MNANSIPSHLRLPSLDELEWLDQQARDQHQLLPAVPSESREARLQRVLRTCHGLTTAARMRRAGR